MSKRYKQIGQVIFLLVLIIGSLIILNRSRKEAAIYQSDQGTVFGTFYSATYQYPQDLKTELESELNKVNMSLSPFEDSSIISKINRNENVVPDSFFLYVFNLAEQVSAKTHGAFDITVAPLVNVWGFGFKKKMNVDRIMVDSIRQFVGYHKVRFENGKIVKDDPRTMLDCSAIAKGFGSDVVARFFDRKGIKNYMIEIGGEIVVKGVNSKDENWRIGVNKPIDDSLAVNTEIETILDVTNIGMATSGNYRNFYYKNGKKYAHTIDPRMGYPVQHSLLSSTVIAPNCATADAYATSFMVLGVDSAMAICQRTPGLDGYFIYENKKGKLETCFTEGMKKYIKRN